MPAVVPGPAVVLKPRLIAWRQPVLHMELTLTGRLARCVQARRGRMLGGPERATGDAGREHGICIVAQQRGALSQFGIEQRRRLPTGEELRTRRHLSEGEGRGREERRDEKKANEHAGRHNRRRHGWRTPRLYPHKDATAAALGITAC